jgi:uncharacterized protein YggE
MDNQNCFGGLLNKKTVAVVGALCVLSVAAFAFEKIYSVARQISNPVGSQSLFVTGNYKVKAVPDVGFVSYNLRVENKDIQKASIDLDTKISKIKSALSEVGIPSEGVYLARYMWSKSQENISVDPSISFVPDSPGSFGTNSFVSQDIVIEIEGSQEEMNTKLARLEKVALDYGLIPISNGNSHICLDFKDKNKVLDLGKKNAVLDARTQAKSLTDAAGLDLGDIISINDNNYGYGGSNSPYSNYCSTQLGSSKVIEPQEITVSIGVTFEIN